jgi:hypothetical protein
VVDTERGIFVVCLELFLDLPVITLISTRAVVCKRFRASELVIAAWCRTYIPMRSYLPRKSSDRSSNYVPPSVMVVMNRIFYVSNQMRKESLSIIVLRNTAHVICCPGSLAYLDRFH